MIEMISSILEAEKNAEEIVKEANDNAKKILLESASDAEKIKNSAIYVQKVHNSSSIQKANEKAQEEYAKVLAVGEKQSEAIIDSAKPNIEKVADSIVEKILG